MEYSNTTPACNLAERQIGFTWNTILIVYYLVLSSVMISYYRHDMNPDGTIYITLGQRYLNGDFGNALSGHWAPMISWLIAPFIALGLEPIIAYRTLSVFIGIMALVGIEKLMVEIEIARHTRLLYLVALSPVVAWYAQGAVGADFLCACVLLYYVLATIRDEYRDTAYFGIVCGMLGAFSYLAKNYNFYFFLLHFTWINTCFWKQAAGSSQKRTIAFNYISAVAVFVLISGVWIGLISAKYHTPTVGTAGAYNFSHIRPGHSTTTHPMVTDGFMPPPHSTAISVWEDPTFVKVVQWNPFRSTPDFLFYLEFITGNIYKYLAGLAANYIFDLTIVALLINCLFSKKPLNRKVRYILLTILLYPLGYFALYYDGQRYVLVIPILLYIVNAYLVDSLFLKYGNNRFLKALISVVLCASLIALTQVRINRDSRELHDLNDIYQVSTRIEKYYNMQNVNIASQDGDWYHTIDLSYLLKARYFGKAKDGITDEQLRRELINYGIKYYLVFGSLKNQISILIPERKFELSTGNMTVYRVTQ